MLVAAGVLTLASCAKENFRQKVEVPVTTGPTLTIRADYPEITDEDGTKLSLDPSISPYKMTWDGGETMTVFAAKVVRNVADTEDSLVRTKFTLTGGTGANLGVFTGALDFGDTGLTIDDIKAVAVGPDEMSATQQNYFKIILLNNELRLMYPTSTFDSKTGIMDGRYMMPHALVSSSNFTKDGDNYILDNVQLVPANGMIMLNLYDSSGSFSTHDVTKVMFVSSYFYSNAGSVNLTTGEIESIKGTVETHTGLTEQSSRTTTLATPVLLPTTKADGLKVFMMVRPPKRTNATKNDSFSNRYVRLTLDDGTTVTKYLGADCDPSKGITRYYTCGNLYTANIDFNPTQENVMTPFIKFSTDGTTWSDNLPNAAFSSLYVKTDPTGSEFTSTVLDNIKAAIDANGDTAGVTLDMSASRYSATSFPAVFNGTVTGAISNNNGITVNEAGTKIKTLLLPVNVTSIAANAFQACTLLESVDLTKVTSIGAYAFANTGLKTLNIPKTVTTCGTCAFAYCWKLEEVWYYPTTQTSTSNSYIFGCRNNKAKDSACPAWYKPYDATTNPDGFQTTLTFHFGKGAYATKYMFDSNTRLARVIFEGNPGNAGADAWFIRCRSLDIIDCSQMTSVMNFTTSNASTGYEIGLFASNKKIYVPDGTATEEWGLWTAMTGWASPYTYTIVEGSPE